MQDIIALLQSLTLPAGATTGQRIVLDGTTGVIQIFNSSNQLVGQIDSAGIFSVFDPSSGSNAILSPGAPPKLSLLPKTFGVHTLAPGILVTDEQTAPDRVRTVLSSPTMDGLRFLQLTLEGEGTDTPALFVSTTGGNVARMQVFGTFNANTDSQVNGISLPRGVMGTFDSAANDAARAAGVNTDMAVTFTADATRLYEVTVKVQFNVGTAAAVYALELVEGGTVGANDGTGIDRFQRWSAADTPAGSLTLHCDSSMQYRPTAGSKTVRVANDAGSGGTITGVGTATIRRQLWVKDIGVR